MKTRCYIAAAGEYSGRETPGERDYIIAADGGYALLHRRGIVPDLVVGDFDSLGTAPEHPNVVRLLAEKDDTDTMLAVRHGLRLGYKDFVIDGGLGGRLDHTIANIQVLAYLAENGARGILLGSDMCVTVIKSGSVGFSQDAAGIVSVFCFGGRAEGVTLTGMKYPLSDATLASSFPLGVSNEFTGEPAAVTVREGTLIIIWQDGNII